MGYSYRMTENKKYQSQAESVLSWVEESGRALELRTARTLIRSGAPRVRTSLNYFSDAKDAREIDVFGRYSWKEKSGTESSLLIAIECKLSPNKPWVGFYQDIESGDTDSPLKFFAFMGNSTLGQAKWVGDNLKKSKPFKNVEVCSHISDSNPGDDGTKESKYETSNKAMLQALSGAAALGKVIYDNRRAKNPTSRDWSVKSIAVVVTPTNLFGCKLTKNGGIELKEVDRLVVRASMRNAEAKNVFIIREHALPEFLAEINRFSELLKVVGNT